MISSSRSSDEHSSLRGEGSSTLQVLQAAVELLDHWGGVRPGPLSERLEERAGLQQMFCCLTVSPTWALLGLSDTEFCVKVVVQAVVACPEPEHDHLLSSWKQVVWVCSVVAGMLLHPFLLLFGLNDGLGFKKAGRPVLLSLR